MNRMKTLRALFALLLVSLSAARAARWYAVGADGVHRFNEGDHKVMSVVGNVKAAQGGK